MNPECWQLLNMFGMHEELDSGGGVNQCPPEVSNWLVSGANENTDAQWPLAPVSQ